jgi:hypothetical protein
MNHLSDPLLKGRLIALPINIRLNSKGLPETNNIASYEHVSITVVKIVITLGPGACTIKKLQIRNAKTT